MSWLPSPADLARLFNAATLANGLACHEGKGVLSIVLQPKSNLITGEVQGSGKAPHRVIVRLLGEPGGAREVLGQCTCREGRQCQHIVALLLEAQRRLSGAEDSDPSAQVQGFAASALPPDVHLWVSRLAFLPAAEDPQILIYLLSLARDGYRPWVLLNAVRMRRLQSGKLGKPHAFGMRGDSRAAYVTHEDRRILTLARSGSGAGATEGLALSDETGPDALVAIAASGRGRWLTPDGPTLSLGEALTAPLAWTAREDGWLQVSLVGAPQAVVLLPLMPPWYLDTETGVCGPVQSGLGDREAGLLAQAPPISPDVAEPLAETTAARAAHVRLPLPPCPQRTPLGAVQITPRLRLYSQEEAYIADPYGRRTETGVMRHFAVLDHLYGDTFVDPRAKGDRVRVTVDGVLGDRPRDRTAEARASQRLARIGLQACAGTLDMGGAWLEHRFCEALPGRHADEAPEETAAERAWWLEFMRHTAPALLAEGWRVEPDLSFDFVLADAGDWTVRITEDGDHWLDIAVGVEVDGAVVDLLPILISLLRDDHDLVRCAGLGESGADALMAVRLPDGRYIDLPAGRLQLLLSALVELFDPKARVSRDGDLRVPRVAAGELVRLSDADPGVIVVGDAAALDWGRLLRDFQGIAQVAAPAGLAAELRPYQRQGLDWLQFLRDYGLGGVLADDMGLGKTIQTLAHLLIEHRARRNSRPSLVVAPTSLMFNWRREAARFAPDLKVLTLHGPDRAQEFAAIPEYDLVLTTYPLIQRDLPALTDHAYHLLILDEAQAIKNPKAKAAQAVRAIDARHRVCLSGTPLENHLGELWALFDFLMPGVLGDERQFNRVFRNPIEREGDSARGESLRRRVAPFLLRRTKDLVAADLPPKTEILREVPLARDQRDLYETLRLALHQKVREEVARRGLAQSGIVILDALLKLRQVCCDPRLVSLPSAARIKGSAKLDLLMELLPELLEEGRRVLLFSQFTSMLALIEEALGERGIKPGSGYVKLTGQTRKRDEAVDAFQSGQAPLFLISLKAGGSGLNLTAADTVIHYDPWWNPAAERQATDRAHRIGQDKPVFVYKLLTEGTVEQRVAELQARKQALADAMLEGGGAAARTLSHEDLDALFSPLGTN